MLKYFDEYLASTILVLLIKGNDLMQLKQLYKQNTYNFATSYITYTYTCNI